MNKEQYKTYLRQRLYEGDIPTIDRSPTNGNILNAGVDLINGGIRIANKARSIFGPSPGELFLAATKDLMDPRQSGIDTITNDTSALRYAARDIPGVASVEKKVAEAGYFPRGGFYDRNNNGKEDDAEYRELAARAAKRRTSANFPTRTPKAKTITGHEGEIPNSDPLPSDTQRA